MSKYEFYQEQKEHCKRMAYLYINDVNMFIFYLNAAQGYEQKQNELKLKEAAQ